MSQCHPQSPLGDLGVVGTGAKLSKENRSKYLDTSQPSRDA